MNKNHDKDLGEFLDEMRREEFKDKAASIYNAIHEECVKKGLCCLFLITDFSKNDPEFSVGTSICKTRLSNEATELTLFYNLFEVGIDALINDNVPFALKLVYLSNLKEAIKNAEKKIGLNPDHELCDVTVDE